MRKERLHYGYRCGDNTTDIVGPGVLGARIGYMTANWALEADVVIIGAGATGLPTAIAASDAGASVLVVEANYEWMALPGKPR